VLGQLAPCAPIAKGEVAGWPVIGSGAVALGVSFLERGNAMSGARVLRRALRSLDAGVAVLNFPEGTTSDGTRLLPFRRGIFGAARLAGVPIVPIALSYASPAIAWTGGASFMPHYLRTAARDQVAARLAIGSPILPWPRDSAGILAAAARREIAALLGLSVPRSSGVPDEPAVRVRVPAPRPDAVLPAAAGRLRALP
jgi:1-acyl-sn-glycerol-3-phosphate acyltransferase